MSDYFGFRIPEIVSGGISLLGIAIGTFVAYHVYKLSKQKSFGELFSKRQLIQKIIDEKLYKIRNKQEHRKFELINVEKYKKYYPQNNTKNRKGYTYMGAELKGYYFGGVEFFCEVVEGYKLNDFEYSVDALAPCLEKQNIFKTGSIPYEFIESVDLNGDDTSNRSQLYAYFNGINKTPYFEYRYYIKDDNGQFLPIKYRL